MEVGHEDTSSCVIALDKSGHLSLGTRQHAFQEDPRPGHRTGARFSFLANNGSGHVILASSQPDLIDNLYYLADLGFPIMVEYVEIEPQWSELAEFGVMSLQTPAPTQTDFGITLSHASSSLPDARNATRSGPEGAREGRDNPRGDLDDMREGCAAEGAKVKTTQRNLRRCGADDPQSS